MRAQSEAESLGGDAQATRPADPAGALSRWRRHTLVVLWLTYASFYLCRVNLAAAQKDLIADRGLGKQQVGLLLALLKGCYAVGQLINGMLADRLGPRVILAAGLAASAGINLVFAHLSELRWMLLAWAANGYVQAAGWTPVVRTIANWFPPRLRDAASGIIGTSYIVGSGLSWVLAGLLTERLGWRYAFWVPPWVCLGVLALFLLALRQEPADVGLDGAEAESEPAKQAEGACRLWGRGSLWALACANLCFFFGYHGLLDWTPHYLAEAGAVGAQAAAERACLMPVGGACGCLALTALARRRRERLRAAAVTAPLLALAGATFLIPELRDAAPGAAPVGLFLLGALSAPPATLMACAMPANLATTRAGTAAGIVDAAGYAGSALSGWLSGAIMDRVACRAGVRHAWRVVWRMWPAGMVIAAGLVKLSSRAADHNRRKVAADDRPLA